MEVFYRASVQFWSVKSWYYLDFLAIRFTSRSAMELEVFGVFQTSIFLRTITRQVTNAMRKLVRLQSSDGVDARWEPLPGVPKVSFLNRNAFFNAKRKTRGHGENNYIEVWRCTREIFELGGGRGNLQWILSVCGYTFYRINIHAIGV